MLMFDNVHISFYTANQCLSTSLSNSWMPICNWCWCLSTDLVPSTRLISAFLLLYLLPCGELVTDVDVVFLLIYLLYCCELVTDVDDFQRTWFLPHGSSVLYYFFVYFLVVNLKLMLMFVNVYISFCNQCLSTSRSTSLLWTSNWCWWLSTDLIPSTRLISVLLLLCILPCCELVTEVDVCQRIYFLLHS